MNNHHTNHHVIHKALETAKHMEPLKCYKSPGLAAVMGFAFGAVGVSFYFKSWLDFFVLSALWIVCIIFAVPTAGVALMLAPCFCASYGFIRAEASNASLGLTK